MTMSRIKRHQWYVACVVSAIFAIGAETASNQAFWDFRNEQFPDELMWFGANTLQFAKPTKEGIRITLPAEEKAVGPVGVTRKQPLHGDFELTVSYELLNVDTPTKGTGIGVRLIVVAQNEKKDKGLVGSVIHPQKGLVYTTVRGFQEADGKNKGETDNFPIDAKQGRLRLTRTGEVLIYAAQSWLGEKRSESDFQELRREAFVTDPVTFQAVVNTGTGAGAADVMIHELRLGSEGERPKLWLWLGILAACLFIGGAVFVLRAKWKLAPTSKG